MWVAETLWWMEKGNVKNMFLQNIFVTFLLNHNHYEQTAVSKVVGHGSNSYGVVKLQTIN